MTDSVPRPNHVQLSRIVSVFCEQALRESTAYTPGMRAAVVATADGFEIANLNFSSIHVPKLAAMASTMRALSDALSTEAQLPEAQNVTIETQDGHMVLQAIRSKHRLVLCLIAGKECSLGHLVWAGRKCAEQLAVKLTKDS